MLVPIAILGSADFDPVLEVDIDSIEVRGARPSTTKFDVEDVNGDGYIDYVFWFRAREMAKPTPEECADPDAMITLTGYTYDTEFFFGRDRVNWIGPDC